MAQINNITTFLYLYKDVFDKEGHTKLCGRDKCRDLIDSADALETDKQHGNEKFGIMDIKSIHELRDKICIKK